MQLALTWAGGEYAWHSSHVIASLVVGIVVSGLFVLWQWKGTSVPLVPCKFRLQVRDHPARLTILVHIFKIKLVNGTMLTMFINGWNFVVQVYYIPTFYQLVYGYSAVKSAALLLPITLMQSKSLLPS